MEGPSSTPTRSEQGPISHPWGAGPGHSFPPTSMGAGGFLLLGFFCVFVFFLFFFFTPQKEQSQAGLSQFNPPPPHSFSAVRHKLLSPAEVLAEPLKTCGRAVGEWGNTAHRRHDPACVGKKRCHPSPALRLATPTTRGCFPPQLPAPRLLPPRLCACRCCLWGGSSPLLFATAGHTRPRPHRPARTHRVSRDQNALRFLPPHWDGNGISGSGSRRWRGGAHSSARFAAADSKPTALLTRLRCKKISSALDPTFCQFQRLSGPSWRPQPPKTACVSQGLLIRLSNTTMIVSGMKHLPFLRDTTSRVSLSSWYEYLEIKTLQNPLNQCNPFCKAATLENPADLARFWLCNATSDNCSPTDSSEQADNGHALLLLMLPGITMDIGTDFHQSLSCHGHVIRN
ncbi:uncharacterized protein LOC117245396 [Parus major]|uniref:uncharacterized protein LOC117245396 n=1 Tax=Parus major TaxID=9157 RepID=UPI0014438F1C|nr:uncharacterized protein LOC117245396 [Parus major]